MAQPQPTSEPIDVCHRHPDRKAGVRCQRCGRPICPDCMVQASVGFHCPECVKAGGTRVLRPGDLLRRPVVTQVLVAINIAVFIAQLANGGSWSGAGALIRDGGLNGPAVDVGNEWWRLVTSGFMHAGIVHLGFNMFILYRLGEMLEPSLGRLRFLLIYVTALLAGSVGALIVQPNANTIGASGAVFGLMGAAVVSMRRQGVNPWQSDVGSLLLLNLVFTFVLPSVSIGGHIGGLAGGALAGWLLVDFGERTKLKYLPALICVGLALAMVPAAFWAASLWDGRV
jgi:membrane associated rhomboid family serine protease